MFQSKMLMWELFVVRLKRERSLLYERRKSAVWVARKKIRIDIFPLLIEELICTN